MSSLPDDMLDSDSEFDPELIPDEPIQLIKVSKNLTKFEVCEDGINAL
jgi:hypothetical protein